jgi:hypothetical protein
VLGGTQPKRAPPRYGASREAKIPYQRRGEKIMTAFKPFTLFVDKRDGTGFAKDYQSESAALRKFREMTSITGVYTLDGKPSPRADRFMPAHVWLKRYEHKGDAGVVVADWHAEG